MVRAFVLGMVLLLIAAPAVADWRPESRDLRVMNSDGAEAILVATFLFTVVAWLREP